MCRRCWTPKASGWDEEVALQAVEKRWQPRWSSANFPQSIVPEVVGAPDASTVWPHDKWVKVVLRLKHPRVVVFNDSHVVNKAPTGC